MTKPSSVHSTSLPVSQVQVVPESENGTPGNNAQLQVLHQILESLNRQNELFEELIRVMGRTARQRQHQLRSWQAAHPELSQLFRRASQVLQRAQMAYIQRIAEEVVEGDEGLQDGEFLLQEFVDRFGPRLAHLNGMLQVFSHLGAEESA